MASIDDTYSLVSIFERITDSRFSISDKNLDSFLIPKRQVEVTRDALLKSIRGIAYTKSPSGYVFRKIQ